MTIHGPSILAFVFAAPAFFVAGLLLVGLPILIHILNRRRYKVVQWAAMEYLLAAMKKNRRRLRFEQWLLLAARCLVMLLVGLALARPMGCSNNTIASLAGERVGLHVFVIDNSASMAYEADRPEAKTHLQQAKLVAKALVDRLSAGGESVAVVTAGSPATAVVQRPTYNLEDAKGAIDRIEQSYSGTDLAGALEKVKQIAGDAGQTPKRTLHVFTDSTRSAFDTPQAGALRQSAQELGKVFKIEYHNLGRPGQANAAVLGVRPAGNLVTTRFNTDFTAVMKGFGNVGEGTVQWKLDDQTLGGGTVRLSAETPPQTLTNVALQAGGPHVVTVSLGTTDRLRVDDVRYRTVNVASDLKVLVVEGDRGVGPMSGSAAFLALALAPPKEVGANNTGGKTDSYISPEVISDLELGNKVLTDYRAVVLTNVGQIQPSVADALKAFVQQGGTVVMYMGEQVNPEAYTQVLMPRGLLAGPLTRRVSVGADEKGYLFDFKPSGNLHPYLELFRGEEKSGLDTAQVFTYVQMQLPPDTKAERVLNYQPREGDKTGAGADPAIVVHTLGQGRVIFFSTTANADWTTLPVKLVYVSLMHELIASSVPAGDGWMNRNVGETLELPANVKLSGAPVLTEPGGKGQVEMTQVTTADGRQVYRSAALARPGVYRLSTGDREYPISVNVPAEEADIRTLDQAAVKAALGDADVQFEEDQVPAPVVAQVEGRDFGWAAMVGVLGLLGAECFMAMRFGHHARGTRATSA